MSTHSVLVLICSIYAAAAPLVVADCDRNIRMPHPATGWREREPQDIGRVVFNRRLLIKARETLHKSYLSRRESNVEAMKDKPVTLLGRHSLQKSLRVTVRKSGAASTWKILLLMREDWCSP